MKMLKEKSKWSKKDKLWKKKKARKELERNEEKAVQYYEIR